MDFPTLATIFKIGHDTTPTDSRKMVTKYKQYQYELLCKCPIPPKCEVICHRIYLVLEHDEAVESELVSNLHITAISNFSLNLSGRAIMIFKTALLLGLLAGCYAAPIRTSKAASLPRPATGSLGRRVPGTLPASVNCGGVNLYRERIEAALIASRTPGIAGKKRNREAVSCTFW